MAKVSIVRVEDEAIFDSVRRSVDLIGGIGRFVKSGDLTVIKVNMFIKADYPTGKITDPRAVIAVARLAAEQGATVKVVERTANIYADFAQFPEIGNYAEVISVDNLPHRHLTVPGAESLRVELSIPDIVTQCDVFINMPSLRTHALTLMSGALKNLMGILPGAQPGYVHLCGLEQSIVDLNLFRPSNLVVMDAIYTLQGNFPCEGSPLKTDLILAGDNAVAVDTISALLLGFQPAKIVHLMEAKRRKLGPIEPDRIELLGESLEDVAGQIRLEKAPSSYEVFRGRFTIIDSSACNSCRQALAGGLVAASHREGFEKVKDLTIITGPMEKEPGPKTENVVLYGNCTCRYRHIGNYIQGCPPLAGQAAEAILSVVEKRR
ncbi:MAG TPA: DUF362 domain-containing protein [Candidatus Latescibacteria bacterium]|nr:DUF362 domain-containing protein [Candidatus Latescibacterota bacterium]